MSIPTTTHITPADGNVFSDLGFEPEIAKELKAESLRMIAEKTVIKNALMTELTTWIELKELKQAEAAKILGVTRPRVSDIVNHKSLKFSIDALVDMLARTGKRVQVSVS